MLSFSAMDAAGRVGVIFVGNVHTALINVKLFLSLVHYLKLLLI